MQEKVKGMLRDMAMPKMKKPEAMPMEGMEDEESPEDAAEDKAEMEAEDLSSLVAASDEEIIAEAEKRGMKVSPAPEGKETASGGASITPLPTPAEEEESTPVKAPPAKKVY